MSGWRDLTGSMAIVSSAHQRENCCCVSMTRCRCNPRSAWPDCRLVTFVVQGHRAVADAEADLCIYSVAVVAAERYRRARVGRRVVDPRPLENQWVHVTPSGRWPPGSVAPPMTTSALLMGLWREAT
eukprot:scaffold422700_cov19-Prasinocladus_malaysianus.AAC.2